MLKLSKKNLHRLIKENRIAQIEDTTFGIPTVTMIAGVQECRHACEELAGYEMPRFDNEGTNNEGCGFTIMVSTGMSQGQSRKFNVICLNRKYMYDTTTGELNKLKALSTLMHECIHVAIRTLSFAGISTHIDDPESVENDPGEIICYMAQSLFHRTAISLFPEMKTTELDKFPITDDDLKDARNEHEA